jgi:hypothetical protein
MSEHAFDFGGWVPAGYCTIGGRRYRFWVPPGSRTAARWGLVIRDDVAPRGTVAILHASPIFELGSDNKVRLGPRPD